MRKRPNMFLFSFISTPFGDYFAKTDVAICSAVPSSFKQRTSSSPNSNAAPIPFAVTVSLYAAFWSVIVSLWAVFGALVGSAVGVFIGSVCFISVGYVPSGIVLIGTSFFCAGLSIFLFYGCKASTKGTVWLTKRIALGIKNLFIRKEKAQ